MTLPDSDRNTIISHRIARANEAIDDVEFLLANNRIGIAMSRIYYGMFYAVNALALKHGFETGKHQRLIGWFNKEFVISGKIDRKYGKILHRAYDNRMSGDYDDVTKFSIDETRVSYEAMKDFILTVEKLIIETT